MKLKTMLQMICGQGIINSGLSKQAKGHVLEYVHNEASTPQLKLLILDGRIDSLDEDSKQIINNRFKSLNESKLKGLIQKLHAMLNKINSV